MFAGAFWSPFNFCKSNIEELINKENLILEDILDDENILSDLKSNNDKFGKFLHRHPQFVKSLVDYIIKEPKDDESDFKICYKYPFVASEILACEILGLIKAFFEDAADADSHMSLSRNFDQVSQESGNKEVVEKEEDEAGVKRSKSIDLKKEAVELKEEMEKMNIKDEKYEMVGVDLLDYLLSFLDNKEKYLNQTLAGYFQKAINAILNKRGFDMLNHLFERFESIKLMIYHSVNKSIIDLLLRILFIDIPFIDAKMTLFLDQRKEIMVLLLETFDKTEDYEEADNIAFLFCDLISKYKNVNAGKELIESLNNPKTLNILFNKLFCKNASIISSSCCIIINLILFFMNKDGSTTSNVDISLTESTKSPMKETKPSPVIFIEQEYYGFFQILEKQMELLIEALNLEKLIPSFTSTFGQEIKPFGNYRLKILEIIGLLIKIGAPFKFASILCKYKIFEIIMNLSMMFEFNTFLHAICEKIVVESVETENEELIKSLFIECRVTAKLIEGITQKELIINKPNRSVQRGYKAFFIKISNFLVKSNLLIVTEILQKDEAWKGFVGTELENINALQNKDLGGHNPKKVTQPEEDDNYKIEIDIKKIYEKFSQYFQNGPVKEKKNDLEYNEIEDDYDKESPPEYASPEKNKIEDEDVAEIIESEDSPEKHNKSIDENVEFNVNNYWKNCPQYKIEDLLKEL